MNTMRNIPATKQDVKTSIEKAVDTIADMIGKGFAHNDTRLDGIESRLGKIENLLLEEQRRKIENLETRMKKLEDALAISPHKKSRHSLAAFHGLRVCSPLPPTPH